MGIGTLINENLFKHPASIKIIFSTGVGYGSEKYQNFARRSGSLKIYCLRGPLSADMLGVDRNFAISDGALLIGAIENPCVPVCKMSFMPHISSVFNNADGGAYRVICQNRGIDYIDPCASVNLVIDSIKKTELLITEAFHGAVVATAFSVPWIPVVLNSEILSFKWMDWCETIGIKYSPFRLPLLRAANPKKRFKFARTIKRTMLDYRIFESNLLRVGRERPQIIDPFLITRLINDLQEKLEKFRKDLKAGNLE